MAGIVKTPDYSPAAGQIREFLQGREKQVSERAQVLRTLDQSLASATALQPVVDGFSDPTDAAGDVLGKTDVQLRDLLASATRAHELLVQLEAAEQLLPRVDELDTILSNIPRDDPRAQWHPTGDWPGSVVSLLGGLREDVSGVVADFAELHIPRHGPQAKDALAGLEQLRGTPFEVPPELLEAFRMEVANQALLREQAGGPERVGPILEEARKLFLPEGDPNAVSASSMLSRDFIFREKPQASSLTSQRMLNEIAQKIGYYSEQNPFYAPGSKLAMDLRQAAREIGTKSPAQVAATIQAALTEFRRSESSYLNSRLPGSNWAHYDQFLSHLATLGSLIDWRAPEATLNDLRMCSSVRFRYSDHTSRQLSGHLYLLSSVPSPQRLFLVIRNGEVQLGAERYPFSQETLRSPTDEEKVLLRSLVERTGSHGTSELSPSQVSEIVRLLS